MTAGAGPDWFNRAIGYPYDIRPVPFLFRPGGIAPLPDGWRPHAGLTPVLAVGSNRAPAQLARKYAGWGQDLSIAVTVADVTDHDVVYSAHFTRYGSLPARLMERSGVRVQVGITWLSPRALTHMHTTEGAANYRFQMTNALPVNDTTVGQIKVIGHYQGRHPPLTCDDRPVALAAAPAVGRQDPALGQHAALTLARDRLAPDASLTAFVQHLIACPVTRQQRTHRLQAAERPRS